MSFVRFWMFYVVLAFALSGCSLTASLDSLLSASKPNPIQVESDLPTVNGGNENSYTLAGTCEDGTKDFMITQPQSISVTCVNGSWSAVVDFSGQPDGLVKVVTDIKNSAGTAIEFEVMKDATPPVLTALTLDSGKAFTKNTLLPFSISHTDGYDIYLTTTPACTAGGTWSLLSSTPLATIGASEGLQTLYAKVRDLAGNESACVSDSITMDLTPPVVSGLTNDATAAKTKSWTWGCSDISSCRYRFVIDQSAVTSPTGSFASTLTAAQNSGDGNYYLHVQAEDEAGNVGSTVHVSAVLDNTGPLMTLGTPAPTTGNSAQIFQWIVTYLGATTVSLSDSDITLSGTATAGCVATVSGAGASSRTVSVTGCSGNGTLEISVAALTAVDSLGNSSSDIGPSSSVTVNNVAPTFILSSATPSTGVAATVFEWTVTYTGADTITLAAGDISYTTGTGNGSQNCLASISTVSSSVRKIQVTGCSGDGTYRLGIAAGSASNAAGNSAAAFTSSEVVSVYNTPVILSFRSDVNHSYKNTDTPVLTWSAQPERGAAPAKYEVSIGTTAGGTNILPWTDVGLVTSYVKKDLSLSYSTTYMANLRLTDTAGKVSAVSTVYFSPSWAGPDTTAYPLGEILTSVKDAGGRRLVGGYFTQVARAISPEKYLTRMNSSGTFEPVTHTLNGYVSKQVELSNGKIIVLGGFSHYGTRVSQYAARLNVDGSFDAGFGVGVGFNNFTQDLIVQPDGKIIIGGHFTTYQGKAAGRIIRLNTDGSRDNSFDAGTGFNAGVVALARQSDGKILATGSFATYKGVAIGKVVRLNADGSLDSSFSMGTGPNVAPNSIVIQSTGKILIAGGFKTVNGTGRALVARLNADGSLHASYGSGGGFSSSFGAGAYIYAQKILLDSSDKLYIELP